MYAERYEVELTTDGSGDAVGYTPVITGRILALHYRKTDFADGVDFDVTTETTVQTIWSEDNVNASDDIYPLRAAQGPDGANITGAYVYPMAVHERIKVVVAQGGASKTGSVFVVVG